MLRLVAADRRTRRAPLNPAAKRTVGQMEDESRTMEQPQESTTSPTGGDAKPGGTETKGGD